MEDTKSIKFGAHVIVSLDNPARELKGVVKFKAHGSIWVELDADDPHDENSKQGTRVQYPQDRVRVDYDHAATPVKLKRHCIMVRANVPCNIMLPINVTKAEIDHFCEVLQSLVSAK